MIQRHDEGLKIAVRRFMCRRVGHGRRLRFSQWGHTKTFLPGSEHEIITFRRLGRIDLMVIRGMALLRHPLDNGRYRSVMGWLPPHAMMRDHGTS